MRRIDILLVEDDEVTAEIINRNLINQGYTVTIVNNGKDALAEYIKSTYDIVIADLHLPIMDGRELIDELLNLEDPPIIIVETSDDSKNTIIELMKKGVTDYLTKPFNNEELIFRIRKAAELAKLQQTKQKVIKDRNTRLEKQQDWNIMKERIAARSYDRFDKTLFSSLKASFNQGAGIGSLITLISLMKTQINKEGSNYIVREDIMELIFQNADMAGKALSTISDISHMLEEEFDLNRVSAQDFYTELKNMKGEINEYSKLKSHRIVLNEANFKDVKKEMLINIEGLKRAFRELLVNALKFSIPNSDIYIFTSTTVDRFYISIMNQPDINITGSADIPVEYEKLIFEPFFRLVKYVYEDYDTLDFGLGLTMVEKVIRKNNGKIGISTIMDSSKFDEKERNKKINFEVSFPLV